MLIKKQLAWTDVCFKQALLDVFGDQLSDEEKLLKGVQLKQLIADKDDANYIVDGWPPSVNEAYLVHMRKLTTDQIELILEAYNKGKQWRSPLTIDVLTTELFERATNLKRGHK